MARKYRKRRSTFSDLCCENCGRSFRPRPRADRVIRFCGRDCYQSSRNRPTLKDCPQCGVSFMPERHYQGESRIHCSRECDHKARVTKLAHTCLVCGALFSRVKSQSPLYCSRTCLGKAFEKRITKVCEWCTKTYECRPFQHGRRFCSQKCIRLQRGESNLERTVREALEDLNIEFIQEHKVKRYRIDFFISCSQLAVEADGGYWHTSANGRLRDIRRDANLAALGITTVRITESEIHKVHNVAELLAIRLAPYLQKPSVQKTKNPPQLPFENWAGGLQSLIKLRLGSRPDYQTLSFKP